MVGCEDSLQLEKSLSLRTCPRRGTVKQSSNNIILSNKKIRIRYCFLTFFISFMEDCGVSHPGDRRQPVGLLAMTIL
jgi:hypothetical protein